MTFLTKMELKSLSIIVSMPPSKVGQIVYQWGDLGCPKGL